MTLLKVKSMPSIKDMDTGESGIKRVIEAYTKYSERFGFTYVDEGYDLVAIHAGMTTRFDLSVPTVSHLHGLYWTADYRASTWEWQANANVVASIRYAERVTVPSEWVAETLQRDMRISPVVIHHGIEWQEWEHDKEPENFVLWNKNRVGDVCSPDLVAEIARRVPDVLFICTFVPSNAPSNMRKIGLQPHDRMKDLIQRASVYLSTTKETFGIGVLEAMASGTPVLGVDQGGNKILVEHGTTGFLSSPNHLDNLVEGLRYCLQYRPALSAHARAKAREWTWEKAVKKVGNVYRDALLSYQDWHRPMLIPESDFLKGERDA